MKFEFLNGPDGEQSSRRLFLFILVILWVVYFFANLFFKMKLSEMFEEHFFQLMVVMFAGVSFDSWTGYLKAKKLKNDET